MTSKQHRPITISIVSHGQQGLLLPLLEQLDRYCATVIAKVVVTVNIPERDLLTNSAWSFPLDRITNARPQGFGTNHNAAFRRCESDWFLVLNPDIRLERDVLQPLLHGALEDSGLLTPRSLEPGSRHAGPEPHRGLLTPLEILTRHRPSYRPPNKPAWIPGMFMMLRAEAYRQIAGFDERFFMYGEDFDLCARLQLSGWGIHVTEDMQVIHDARRASRTDRRHLMWHFGSLARLWLSSAFWRYRRLSRRTVR
jgi:N-acetylglucosaminyl-diphospho-decaprenol L-rhamnosyltransferase